MRSGKLCDQQSRTVSAIQKLIQNRPVIYITTKEPDYIRCSQEIRLLQQYAASVTVVGSDKKKYSARLREVYHQLRKHRFTQNEVIFVGFAPQLVIPLFRKRFTGHMVIQDFFISFYDTLVQDRKKVRAGSLPARMLHRLDEKTIQYGKLVVADTNADADYFAQEFHRDRQDIVTLYLEADPAIYHPDSAGTREQAQVRAPGMSREKEEKKDDSTPRKDDSTSRKDDSTPRKDDSTSRKVDSTSQKDDSLFRKDDDAFRVLYFGSILPLQGVDVVLSAIRELVDEGEMDTTIPTTIRSYNDEELQGHIHFELIGPIPEEQKFQNPCVDYIDWLPQEELARHIARADLCLAGHFSGSIEKARRTIAGKTFIYRAMSKPVVLGDNPANRERFQPMSGMIYYCRMGDSASLAAAIRKAYSEWRG